MKKSRIAKLALLGASAAALAATLSTSTYAWYVSNKTATVAKMDGMTSAGQADGSILLSWNNAADSYYKELKWTDENIPQNVVETKNGVTTFKQKLSPVYYVASSSTFTSINTYKKTTDTALDNEKTYYTLSGTTYTAVTSPDVDDIETYYEKANTAGAVTTGFVQFSMYIKSDADNTQVTISPVMHNTTDSSAYNSLKQIAYVPTGSVEQGESFIVDAFDAMYYSLNIDDAATATAVVAAPSSGKSVSGAVTPGAAHSYYESVTGEDIEAQYEAAVSTTALSTITVGTTPKKLTWTIWLAGNDLDCYNSCAGQGFDFSLTYKAA